MIFDKFRRNKIDSSNYNQEKNLFLISCDGGGSRGIIVADILAEIENEMRMQGLSQEMHRYFDVFSSTSMSTLIICLLLHGSISMEEVRRKILEDFFENFVENNSAKMTNIFSKKICPRYINDGLEELFKYWFGEEKLGTLKKNVAFPFYDILNFSKYEINNVKDANISLHKLVLASMVVPEYFFPVVFGEYELENFLDSRLVDGSICSTNPIETVYSYAITQYEHYDNIYILSIGAGIVPISNNVRGAYSGWIAHSEHPTILQLIQNSNAENHNNIVSSLANVEVFRINGYLKNMNVHNWFDISQEYIDNLHINAIEIIHNNRLEIKKFVSLIKDNRERE